jgi:hypothetical protein
VLGCLVDLEPVQAALLEKVCIGKTISAEELRATGAFQPSTQPKRRVPRPTGPGLFDATDI